MTLEDQLSGNKIEVREPFKVTDPLPEPPAEQSASAAPPVPPSP